MSFHVLFHMFSKTPIKAICYRLTISDLLCIHCPRIEMQCSPFEAKVIFLYKKIQGIIFCKVYVKQ